MNEEKQTSDDLEPQDVTSESASQDAQTKLQDTPPTSQDAQPRTHEAPAEEVPAAEMDRLRREVEDARKRVLQAQADAENFRKRMRRDYEDQLKYAAVPLVGDILQVRDNLTRAIDAAGSAEQTTGLKEGVQMVAKQLDDTLAKHGVQPIPAEGETFDPNVHEAISQIPSEDHPQGVVAHVAVAGFQMHGRVIRPAQVVVSTGSPG